MSINKALATQLLEVQHRLQEAEGVLTRVLNEPVNKPSPLKVGDRVVVTEGEDGNYFHAGDTATLTEWDGQYWWGYVDNLSRRHPTADGSVCLTQFGKIAHAPAEPSPRMCSGVDETAVADAFGQPCPCGNTKPHLVCKPLCECRQCATERGGFALERSRMRVCPNCKDKRCPKADDHRNGCREMPQPPADPPIPAMPERQHDPVAGLERESSYIRRTEAHARELERRLSEATRRAEYWKAEHNEANKVNCALQAQVQTLAEAAKGMLGPEWECGHGTPITEPCGFCKEEDNPCHRWRAALASLEVKP